MHNAIWTTASSAANVVIEKLKKIASNTLLEISKPVIKCLKKELAQVPALAIKSIFPQKDYANESAATAAAYSGTMPPAVPAAATSLSQQPPSTYWDLASFFKNPLAGARDWFLTTLALLFDSSLEKEQPNQPNQQAITSLRSAIQTAIRTGKWEELYSEMSKHQLYIHGISIPRFGVPDGPSTSPFQELSRMIQRADQSLSRRPGEGDAKPLTAKKVEEERESFVRNASYYFAMNKASHWLQGKSAEKNALLAHLSAGSNSQIQASFYRSIDASNAFFLWRWLAKGLFFTISHIFTFALDSFSREIITDLRAHFDDSRNGPLKQHLLSTLTRFFTTLGGSYNEVAKQIPKDVIDEMVREQQMKPETNHGFSSTQLYNAFAKTLIDKFAPRITWTEQISQFFNEWLTKLSNDTWLHRISRLGILLLSGFWQCMAWAPQTLFNPLWTLCLKLFGVTGEQVSYIVSQSAQSLRDDNGSTHALNLTLLQQLNNLWDALKQPSNATPAEVPTANREQLSTLVRNILEVLAKSKYDTPDTLKRFVEGKSQSDQLLHAFDALFIEEVIEKTVAGIAAASSILFTKEQLEKQVIFNSLEQMNRTYKPENQVSDDEVKRIEQEVELRLKQILDFSLQKAVEDKFNTLTGKAAQEKATRFLFDSENAMKPQTEHTLHAIERWSSIQPTTQNTTAIVEVSKEFLKKRSDAQYLVQGESLFDTRTKEAISSLSSSLSKHYNPIALKLDEVLDRLNEIQEHATLRPRLEHVKTLFEKPQPTIDEINHQITSLTGLQDTIKSPRSKELIKNIISQIKSLNDLIEKAITINNDINNIETLQKNLRAETNPIQIASIKSAIKDIKFNSKEIQTAYQQLMNGKTITQSQINDFIQFQQTAQKTREQTNQEISSNKNTLLTYIQQSPEMDDKAVQVKTAEIEERRQTLNRDILGLRKWLVDAKAPTLINISLARIDAAVDIAKAFLFNRIHTKVQGLVQLFRKPHVYIGMAHHVVLIPFVEANEQPSSKLMRKVGL